MGYITSSYLQKNLLPLNRVYRIWFATFSFRLWRFWIEKEDSYNLEISFISPNSYTCLEILAHSLILGIRELRDNGQPHLFLP